MTICALEILGQKQGMPSLFLNAMSFASVVTTAEIEWSRGVYNSTSRCSRQIRKAGDFVPWNLYQRGSLSVNMLVKFQGSLKYKEELTYKQHMTQITL